MYYYKSTVVKKAAFIELFGRYRDNQCTAEEAEQLIRYIQSGAGRRLVEALISEGFGPAYTYDIASIPEVKESLDRVFQQVQAHKHKPTAPVPVYRSLYRRWAAIAAAVAVFLSIGISLYWYTSSDIPQAQLTSRYGDDALPGSNRATITFDDGTVMELADDKDGIIANGTELTYADGEKVLSAPATIQYATLSTPRGGQYRLTLPDGTTVWLNSGSTLRYPQRFDTGERVVELEGEAYFSVTSLRGGTPKQSPNSNEIASARTTPHSLAMTPFLVKTNSQIVEVLGTQFNIAAYADEPEIKTTLVEGSVRLTPSSMQSTHEGGIILKPGEQATTREAHTEIQAVDVEQYIAWKDGRFVFQKTDLRAILRQLERWYDIEVDYTRVPERQLSATLSRHRNLSNVLVLLEESTGLSFRLKERRLSIE